MNLAEVFSGNKFLDGVESNECLKSWFKDTSGHVNTLQQEDSRIIAQLLEALGEVQGKGCHFCWQKFGDE